MEKALIVAKTRMKSGVCVSGLTASNESIRLIPRGLPNQARDTGFDIGQVWNIDFQKAPDIIPPHVEDVIVITKQYVGKVTNLYSTLMRRIQPWRGGPEQLHDGMLTIEQGKCYIARSGPIPKCSTGYWLPNRPLTLDKSKPKPYYLIEHQFRVGNSTYHQVLSIPYVGFETPVKQISQGTLTRISLARWLPPYNDRCYLQISGWYT